jgi:hypothetical protein
MTFTQFLNAMLMGCAGWLLLGLIVVAVIQLWRIVHVVF